MATIDHATLPELIVQNLVQTGIDAISAELTTDPPSGTSIIDNVLEGLTDDEKVKARSVWTKNPPSMVKGYPRIDSPFPIYAMILSSDLPNQQYMGLGDHAFLDEADEVLGAQFAERNEAAFTFFVYAEHPDITVWYYRILRRILNVGKYALIRDGLQEPILSGADLEPNPKYTPDNLFGRALTLKVQYQEIWTNTDPLWAALNGAPGEFITSPDQLDVRHQDSDPTPGGVKVP